MNIFEEYFQQGETIQYLNVDFVILSFTTAAAYPDINKMTTEYIDGRGQVVQKTFSNDHLIALVRANGMYVKYVHLEKERNEQLEKLKEVK